MKKPYVKPTVSAPFAPPTGGKILTKNNIVEMDADVIRMLTNKGFEALFWEKLSEARKVDKCTTQEEVFDALNHKYFKAIGCRRYSCYDSFRKVRDRK